LSDRILPRGRTALFDAIVQGLTYADAGMHERKVLIVISDGGDNASQASFDDVLRQAQRSNALIYAVLVRDPLDTEAKPDRLKRLVQQSGGEVFAPRDVRDMPEVLAHVARDIRSMYTLGYSPADDKGPGLRRLRVRVTDPDGTSLRVRTRDGYRVGNTR
jgi:VWFA-related protein